jgi:hypothetical protein
MKIVLVRRVAVLAAFLVFSSLVVVLAGSGLSPAQVSSEGSVGDEVCGPGWCRECASGKCVFSLGLETMRNRSGSWRPINEVVSVRGRSGGFDV